MLASSLRLGKTFGRIGCAGALLSAAAWGAQGDEDWRKLRDFKGPVFGQPVRSGEAVPTDAASGSGAARNDFDAMNMHLGSWLPLNSFSPGASSGNDCWGYVSPSGREYAIIGLSNGFGFAEVTDPANAQVIAFIPGANSMWHDVKVVGHYAYGVSEGGLGIQVIDMSQIDDGIVTLVRNKTQMGHTTTHNIAANTTTGYLYLCGANIANGGLVAVSTADPSNPVIVGSWSQRYVHDAQIVSYTSGPLAGREIAYCFNGGSGVEVIDVTNKNSMTRIGGTSYPGVAYCHQGWMSEDGQYLYVDDELDEGSTVSTTTTRVFSLANPANPSYISSFTTGRPAIDHNLYIRGNRIYEANYRSGLRVFDRTNPIAPVEIAYFDTYPNGDSANFNGAWSVYPFFPSGAILISDIERGLFVVGEGTEPFPRLNVELVAAPTQLTPGTAPVVSAHIEEVSGEETASVTLRFKINGGPEQTVAMTEGAGNLWSAAMPSLACFDKVTYRVTALAVDGSQYTTGEVTGVVYTDSTTVFADTFQTNTGWTVANVSVTDGAWQRGVPAGDGSRGDPTADFDGSGQCYLTANRAGNSDLDGGPTRLTSPVVNLEGHARVTVSYARWFYNDDNDIDRLTTEVSNNNGASWVTVHSVGNTDGWQQASFNVEDYVTPTAQVRVRFNATDNPNDSVTEAAIDAFSVVSLTCDAPACPADYNGDLTPDVLDFLDFMDDFGSCQGEPTPCGSVGNADINGDNAVDILDFLDFFEAFGQGC